MNLLNIMEQFSSTQPAKEKLSRRDSLLGIFDFGKKVAWASIPASVLAALPQVAAAKDMDAITDTLNFALTLEYLERDFYNIAVGTSGLIPGSDRAIFVQIAKHETDHVTFLKSALGSAAIAEPNFDFTAGGTFTPFTNYTQFLALSQAFEDTGVRAYKGQAGNLVTSKSTLTAALQIHSVEARHASQVRRLRASYGDTATKGWITQAQSISGVSQTVPVYAGDDNTTQGGVNLTTLASLSGYSSDAITEAFDEPLTEAQVRAIANLFIHP